MKLTTTTTISLLFLITLSNAQSWVRQNPFATLSQMYDIDFDGRFGLVVGSDATIFTTTNGGTTWVPRQATDSATIIQTAHVVPGTMGQRMFAAGSGIIMITEDGGETWTTTHDEVPSVYKIQSLPGGVTIALGRDFGVYSLNNGGFWQPFNMPAFGVTAGHFLSILEGWVGQGTFGNMQVWYTDDGGATWNLRDPQLHPIISSLEMLNGSIGFLASRDFVFKTIDGGDSWLPLHAIAANTIHDLHVADENNLWTALDNGSVYFSTLGGALWEEVNPNVINSNRTLGIWANASGQVWTVGKYLSILYSTDFGENWVDQLPAAKNTLFEPNFFNALTGMVGGADGTILRTKNSGATWESINLPRDETFFGTVMLSDSSAVVGSTSGKVFRTADQGNTWVLIGENLGQITDLHAENRQVMIITNESGDIYKTTDGGANWNRMHNGSDALFALTFNTPAVGWASGSSGIILNTTDGGDTWNPQLNDGKNNFSDVFFTSLTEGWVTASGFTDTIWRTTNGGTTWEKVVLPYRTFWHGVSFMDRDTGWIVGGSTDNGVILRTDTRGLSWYLDHTSPDPFRGIYSIPNSETAWAVGFGGNIMKYSSCSLPPVLIELRGNLEPCAGDTINFVVDFDDVDLFDWTYPADWLVLGNTNTASIHFIAGSVPGQVTVQGSDACGDTTAILQVNVNPVTPPEVIITEDNGTLLSNFASGLFQWLLNGEPIPGANEETYTPTVNGTYQLHLTTFTSNCETVSNALEFVITHSYDVKITNLVVFPNPANNQLFIKFSDGHSDPLDVTVSMVNIDGKMIFSKKPVNGHISFPSIPAGIYSLHIQTGHELTIRKIIIE